jgi:EpsI family protein
MTRNGIFFAAALTILGTSGALLVLPYDAREVPLARPFDLIPTTLAYWTGSADVPADVLPRNPDLRDQLLRTYRNGSHTMWVSVEYDPYQREGRRLAAHRLPFPGSGWSELTLRPMRIDVDTGLQKSIPANLVLMRTATRRAATLYWYQVGPVSLASDYGYRALLLYNRLIHRRAEGALVRIVSPVPESGDQASIVVKQTEFIRTFYPELLRSLPEASVP